MVFERFQRKDEKEMRRIIRATGPSLLFLLGGCSVIAGILSEGGKQEVFAYTSLGFGSLAAIVLAMYGFDLLGDFRKKK